MIYTDFQVATSDYFAAMGIAMLKGRLFTEQDHGQAPAVVVINECMASKFWPQEEVIGQRIRIGGQRYEIVGVVGNVRHFGLSAAVRPETYVPHTQRAARSMMLAIRTKADPTALASDVRAQVTQLDPNLPLADVRTLEASIAGTTSEFRTITLLLGTFAIAALALAGLGLYGVISYSVAQRTREFGIRLALGAQRGDVRYMVVRQGVILTLIGLAIGLAVSFASGRVLTSLLYEVKATDPLTFGTVSVILGAVALAASLIPARRATRIHPMEALRYE